MHQKYKLKEELCISKLAVHKIAYNDIHHYETRIRKVHNSFGFIEKGSAEFSTLSERVVANEGDLVFIPEGIRYMSHWSGAPHIRFYSLDFIMPKKSVDLWRNMKLQRVNGAPNDKVLELLVKMCECSSDDSDIRHLEGIGFFYQLLALVFPHMQATTTQNLPQPLQTAVAYIEANYATITSVKEIATACFLSESRLYHLFREHLNVSPISYLNHIRVHASLELLSNPNMSIQEIAEALNFHSEYYFRKTFQKITGELPSKLRKML